MWRASSSTFGSPVHDFGDWGLVRQQLGAASIARATGEIPLTILIAELQAIQQMVLRDGRLPFEGSAQAPFRSLSVDLLRAVEAAGPRIRERVGADLAASCDPQWTPARGDDPWPALLKAGSAAYASLDGDDAAFDALLDAFDAVSNTALLEEALDAVIPLLDELRAIVELQGRRSWETARHLISSHVTVYWEDSEGRRIGGKFPEGASEAEILESLATALRRPAEQTTWAVWIATRAGPGPHERNWPTIVAGPVAVSGVTCAGDVGEWMVAARADLIAAYENASLPVPADIEALGEPELYDGREISTAEDLWSFGAAPPSFFSRVEVLATTQDEAVRTGKEAIRASFAAHDAYVGGDLLNDVVLWTSQGGWYRPSASARANGSGELFAPRIAGRAVSEFGADLGTPLDREKLELLKSRALVRDPNAALEVRVIRAWTELERLKPRESDLVGVASWLWLATAWQDLATLTEHVVNRVLNVVSAGSPRDGVSHDDLHRAIKTTVAAGMEYNGLAEALDLLGPILEQLHSDGLTSILVRLAEHALDDPGLLAEGKERHAIAFRRAHRHRNLATHGHRLPDLVLSPTAAFLGLQLEIAVGWHEAERHENWRWVGSLSRAPQGKWERRTPRELDARVIATRERIRAD